MANHPSAEKRNRQRIESTNRNRAVKSAVRTAVKKARTAIAGGDSKKAADPVKAASQALARAASNTFAGIRPADAPGFIVMQFVGAAAATALFRWLVPSLPEVAGRVVDFPENGADERAPTSESARASAGMKAR